jgi:hypothetical protein
MPRKKHSKKRSTHHRKSGRRMGKVDTALIETLLAAGAGGVASGYVLDKIVSFLPDSIKSKLTAKQLAWAKAAVEAVGGYLLASKARKPIIRGVGIGIAVQGLTNVGRATGLISGVNPATLTFPTMNKTVGGYSQLRKVSGTVPKPQTVGAPGRSAMRTYGGGM